jgi:hypothetical protein
VIDVHTKLAAIITNEGWTLVDGLLLFKGKVFVPEASPVWPLTLADAHECGHEGIEKMLHQWRASFYNKMDDLHPAGLLQPLLVPFEVWSDIVMDFVEGFRKVDGKSVVLTVVDRFSKSAHLIPLSHPYTAASVAKALFDNIVQLQGSLAPL